MTGLTILVNELQKTDINFSNSNRVRKCNDKDFSKILEGKEISDSDAIKNQSSKTQFTKEEKVTENELDTKDDEKLNKIKDGLEEAISLFDSIYKLLLGLSSSTEKISKIDLETLNIELKQLSTVLEELLNQKQLIFTNEDQKNILEIFDSIEHLELLTGNKVEVDKELIKECLDELEDNFNELKEIFQSIRPRIDGKTEYTNKEPLKLEKDRSIEEISYGQSEEIKPDEMTNMAEEFPSKNESNTENIKEPAVETNVENTETNTLIESPILQIYNENTLKADPEIQNIEFQEIDNKAVFDQVVEKAKLIVDDDKQEIRIKLKPEILGELVLKMEMEKGELLAKVLVDNYRTKELIEANLFQFKEEMKENGLEIKTFEVFVGTNEDFERENRREFNLNKRPSKLKIKNNGFKEIKAYDESSTGTIQRNYHEGQLNLFA
ncbi:flagellar hook-length control protein FliK [Clostridium sp. Cult1]|uniref:flagellar hook-length control protein FliK n=1 Tax=Clostridium sp. Cult1 TaxID=2079002 RepID=UPI001F31D7EA|nr:flagellar hook-length control protein FliK [Clostridium sp. Cult1]MCF6463336.1 hypothetical protein [Clostridium sp. Cult1]